MIYRYPIIVFNLEYFYIIINFDFTRHRYKFLKAKLLLNWLMSIQSITHNNAALSSSYYEPSVPLFRYNYRFPTTKRRYFYKKLASDLIINSLPNSFRCLHEQLNAGSYTQVSMILHWYTTL